MGIHELESVDNTNEVFQLNQRYFFDAECVIVQGPYVSEKDFLVFLCRLDAATRAANCNERQKCLEVFWY